jgi:hypothetical protein
MPPTRTKTKASRKTAAKPTAPHYKGISRIDSTRAVGWFVRVSWHGQHVRKFFSDGVNGGKRKALLAAIEYRNTTEKTLGKPRTDRNITGVTRRSNTGLTGIRKIIKDGQPSYDISWSPRPGVLQRTSISIVKHGAARALAMAKKLRSEKEREIYGTQRAIYRKLVRINVAPNRKRRK